MTFAFLRLHIYDFYRGIPDLQRHNVYDSNGSFGAVRLEKFPPMKTDRCWVRLPLADQGRQSC